MCGIFGYIGSRDALTLVVDGLNKLEYRGYDSAGVATISGGKLIIEKKVGKVASLEEALKQKKWPHSDPFHIAIAHTRWATHGKPSEKNAHPHPDEKQLLTVVHNGIIENYELIREKLQKKGIVFRSETDTEVISQLIGYYYKGDFLKAVRKALAKLKGSFAIAVIHQNHQEEIICAANESPLAIGIGEKEMFISSDTQVFANLTKKVVFLHSSEVAIVKRETIEFFDANAMSITKEREDLEFEVESTSKGSFQHFMLKEIYEQPQCIRNALLSRYSLEYGTAILDELNLSDEELSKIQKIVIVACGTSYHAGLIGAYMMEEMAHIPVSVEIASEFRYKNPIVQENTLALVISQSGETADTIAAMRELKAKGAKIIGITNVQGSTLAREVGSCLFLRAGPEVGVASTKAFTSQLVVLALFTLKIARLRTLGQKLGKDFIQALHKLPQQIKNILDDIEPLQKLAKKYASFDNFFFVGRRFMYPTALEGALKLKEIAYVHATGYPAGEMKHGPLALVDEKSPIIAFCCDEVTFTKTQSNLMEMKARNGKILAICDETTKEAVKNMAEDIVVLPSLPDALAPILSTVVSQLLAYFIALHRGTNIDKPRNLAKSVTVE